MAMRARCDMLCPARKMRGILRRWRRAVDGNVAVEFGFLVPILVMLALGTFDFGRLGLTKITVSSAAFAGSQFGAQDFVTAVNSTGMEQAARNDAGDTTGNLIFDPAPRYYCVCTADGEVSCTAPCSDSGFPMMYVEVTVQDNVQLLFDYPGLSQTQTVVSTSRIRVR
jgi:hypothetical protein